MSRVLFISWLAGCSFQIESGIAVTIDAATEGDIDAVTCHARWLAGDVKFGKVRALPEVNSQVTDRDPTISSDELTLYWSSGRAGSKAADVWRATRVDLAASFGTPVNQDDVNSSQAETRLSITADGLIAAIGSDRNGTTGGIDVWIATRATTSLRWGAATQTGLNNINKSDNQHDPFLSGDGLRLYFAPTANGQHIEVASRATTSDPFGLPVSLVDSTQGDADPTLSPDERIVVWASRRTDSAGVDLWYATRSSISVALQPAVQLPMSVNSTADDGDPALSADGCRLYFSSNRNGGLGEYDLYVVDVVVP